MKTIISRFVAMGCVLVLFGVALGIGGTVGMARFFQNGPGAQGYTVAHVARGLVAPHIGVLAGLTCFMYGMILVVKAIVFAVQERRAKRLME